MSKKIPDRLKSYKGVTPLRPEEISKVIGHNCTDDVKNIRFIICDENNFGNRARGTREYKTIKVAVEECLKLNRKHYGNDKQYVSPRFYVVQLAGIKTFDGKFTYERPLN